MGNLLKFTRTIGTPRYQYYRYRHYMYSMVHVQVLVLSRIPRYRVVDVLNIFIFSKQLHSASNSGLKELEGVRRPEPQIARDWIAG